MTQSASCLTWISLCVVSHLIYIPSEAGGILYVTGAETPGTHHPGLLRSTACTQVPSLSLRTGSWQCYGAVPSAQCGWRCQDKLGLVPGSNSVLSSLVLLPDFGHFLVANLRAWFLGTPRDSVSLKQVVLVFVACNQDLN